ncbi:unnamed protein product [Adineta ricciae]|uniref:Uncharacterized protein n=1 Tax=Adineta ricciae TaxID=249248 RepID=A0A815MVU8_ADIRI|nr:unnamed protein product [Adineta ricciae]
MGTHNGWSLRYAFFAGLLIVISLLYIFYHPKIIGIQKLTCLTPVNETKRDRHFLEATTSEGCNVDKLLLQKCSHSEFTSTTDTFINVDDILYGYDVLFENDYLFTASSWLGVQYQSTPNDAMVFQQLIWGIKPDLIIDLGTNFGGSAVFFASIMSFHSEAGIVLTIDRKSFTMDWVSDRRTLCKDCVNATDNKLWKTYFHFIQRSTNDVSVLAEVKKYVANARTVFISHDAAHDCDSVYEDL